MALVVSDRVKETTATTGTGTYTLAGAEAGFQSFTDGVGDANTTYYTVTDDVDWEVGLGTFTAAGTLLSRDTVLASSNADAAVSWAAGDKTVFVTQPASNIMVSQGAGIDFTSGVLSAVNAIQTEAADYTVTTADADNFIRMTNVSTKLVNIPLESTEALPANGQWNFRNVGAGVLTITPAGGVTVNLPTNGSLSIPEGGTFTLKRVAADEFDLFGTTTGPDFYYSVGFYFTSTPVASEILLIHAVAEPCSIPADFASALLSGVGTNPTSTFAMDVQNNGVTIGTISVSTGGVVTATTAGSVAKTLLEGDILKVVAPTPADATIADCAFTIRGVK